MIRNIAFAILLLLSFGCKKHSLNENEFNRLSKEVEAALRENFATINREGWVGELKALDNSPQFSWVPPGKYEPLSYDSLASILTKASSRFASVDLQWTSLYVKPLTQSIATFTGTYKSTYTLRNNQVSVYNMAECGTLIKRGGKWRIISGQTFRMP